MQLNLEAETMMPNAWSVSAVNPHRNMCISVTAIPYCAKFGR